MNRVYPNTTLGSYSVHSKPMYVGKMNQRVLWGNPREHMLFVYPLTTSIILMRTLRNTTQQFLACINDEVLQNNNLNVSYLC